MKMYEESTFFEKARCVCFLFNAGLVRILPPPAKAQDMAALVQVPKELWMPCHQPSRGSPGEQRNKNTWLFRGFVGDYTTQSCRDSNEPLHGSLLNNQYNGKSEFFL